ncbi:MAG: hypothetical protein Q8N13_20990, partial [Acidovorax sp.]|nr:hypothetical protein [Acidovorax sp.]
GLGLPGSQAHSNELDGTFKALDQAVDYVKSEGAAGTIGRATDTLVRATTGDASAAGDAAAALTGIGSLAGAHSTVQRMAAGVDRMLATAGNNAAKSRIVGRAMEEIIAKTEPALAAKTPSIGPEQVRPVIGETTPVLIREGTQLASRGEITPAVATTKARLSQTAPEVASQTLGGAANSSISQVARNQAAGNAARDAIAAARPGSLIEQNFRVTGGLRRVDVLDGVTAIESKVGRTSLSAAVRQELARDIKLLRSGQIDAVEWHFFPSPTTGFGGPTGPLRAKLNKFGIPIEE